MALSQVTEDFESGSATGWITSGTASTGTFVVASPTQQVSSVITQPSGDHTSGLGINAYFTATNISASFNDVDGGTAISTSPVYVISTASKMSIWYFFGQRDTGNAGDSNDFFRLEYSLNSGVSFTTLVFIGDITTNAVWTEATASIPAGSNVVLRVTASDGTSPGDIIEAGIDDLSIVPNTDTDGDGIYNVADLDDDNDGIPDLEEGDCAPIINNSDAELPLLTSFTPPISIFDSGHIKIYNASYVPFWETTASDNAIEIWDNGNTLTSPHVNANTGIQFMELNAYLIASNYQDINTAPNTEITWSIAHRGRDGTDVATVSIGTISNVTVQQTMTTGNTAWTIYTGLYLVPVGQTVTRFQFDAVSTSTGNTDAGNFIDSFTITCILPADSDNDGIPDYLDLDSDNDGIYDLVEGRALDVFGVNDANNDGIIDGTTITFGSNGLFNSIEDNDTSIANISYTISDSDGDGTRDAVELDSDNDGCNDVIEAGYTDNNSDGILAALPTIVNANGLVTGTNVVDGYTLPRDGDSNSTFDFQELNPLITSQSNNQTICGGVNGSFNIVAVGPGLLYQWQVSTDGGFSFSDISNGGVYSGTNLATLNIVGVPESMDNYQYRINIINNAYLCSQGVTSNAVTLTVLEAVSYVISKTSVTTIGGSDGTFTLSGLAPNTTYSISYIDDGIPVPASNLTSNVSGEITITNLNAGSYTDITAASLSGCSGPVLAVLIQQPSPPLSPAPGGTLCAPLNLPSTCTYDETNMPPSSVTIGFGQALCIDAAFSYNGSVSLTNGGTIYVSNGVNLHINGSLSLVVGSEIILADCASISVNGSWLNSGGTINAYCAAQIGMEHISVLNNSYQPTCNVANTYCPVSSFFGSATGSFDLNINPCITTSGDVTECEESPVQTLVAIATAPVGSGVVWYDAPVGGTTVVNPILNSSGTITYYAESVDDISGLPSSIRTPITLTIVPAISIDDQPLDQIVFAGYNGTFTVNTSNTDTYQWQLSTDGGTVFNNISDGADYTGVQTDILTVNTVALDHNGHLFRVLVSNSTNSCPLVTSDPALLTVRVRRVITNRRITHRVKKN